MFMISLSVALLTINVYYVWLSKWLVVPKLVEGPFLVNYKFLYVFHLWHTIRFSEVYFVLHTSK
jgi:hypothetical protein